MYNSFNKNVWIYRNYSDGSRRSAKDIFNTVLHELGHRMHDKKHNYLSLDKNLKESWGETVGYVFTEAEYGVTESSSNENHIHDQDWTSGDYTPIMIDLIDNYNQRSSNPSYLNDPISGYTINQMWGIVKKGDVKKLSDFVDDVKALPLPRGVTRAMLDNNFAQY